MSIKTQTKSTVPQHIAIIMDGNRRWAKQHAMEVLQGHEYVADKVIEQLVDQCVVRGVSFLTLWAFSTENWGRDSQEVAGLMQIFRKSFSRSAEQLHAKGVRLRVIGDLAAFPSDIQENVAKWLDISAKNTKITVIFALNYGGRDELIRAINEFRSHEKSVATPEIFSKYLDTADTPDPDLIIRPGGEKRLSGFLPWQSVYAELYFTDVLMPDFDAAELDKALADYAERQRRFGK